MIDEIEWGPWNPEWPNPWDPKWPNYPEDSEQWEYAIIPSGTPGIKGLRFVSMGEHNLFWVESQGEKSFTDRIFRRPKQTAKPSTPVSIRILEQAAQIQRDRSVTYDQGGTMEGERSMGRTVQAFNVITGRDLSESEGWLLLQILKDVRDRANGPHEDSLVDCTSYSSLKAEARLKEGKQ